MNPKSSIEKGKELERFVAEKFNGSGLDFRAKRQPGSGNGKSKGDIDNDLGWCIECKNEKRFNWKEAAKQVEREAMGHQKEAICWHPPFKPLDNSVIIININDFIDILVKVKNSRKSGEILDKWQIKNNLDRAIYHLKQVVRDI
jgi:hypothetical protein